MWWLMALLSRLRRHREPSSPSRRSRAREAGATLVEAAFITPVFFLLIFGVIEVGGAYRDKLTVSNAVTAGARTGSAAADDSYADYNILQSIKKAVSAGDGTLVRIVVFKASGPDGVPSDLCKAGSAQSGDSNRVGACNVYTPASFAEPKTKFGCQAAYNLDRYYCPTSRKVALSAATGGPPDIVGVWITLTHRYYTGFLGRSTSVITDQAVITVEARRL